MKWLALAMCVLFVSLAAVGGSINCGPVAGGQPTVPPTVVDVGTCILDTVSKDLLSGMGYLQAIEDAAVKCLGGATPANVAQVESLWSAGKAAFERTRGLDAGHD